MNAIGFIKINIFTILISISSVSCSNGDNIEDSINWNPHFKVGWKSGDNLLSGETYTYIDDLNSHEIWISPDDNLEEDKRIEFARHEIVFATEGPIEITSESHHRVLIKFKEPGIGRLIAYDYTENRNYFINII